MSVAVAPSVPVPIRLRPLDAMPLVPALRDGIEDIPHLVRHAARTTAAGHRLHLVDFGPVGTTIGDLPDPAAWVRVVAVTLYEAATGARPATQVMRWLGPDVYDSIVRRSGRAARRGGATRRPVRLRGTRICVLPGTDDASAVVEAAVVIDDHHHVRAMALRLEGLDGRWLVTVCEIG